MEKKYNQLLKTKPLLNSLQQNKLVLQNENIAVSKNKTVIEINGTRIRFSQKVDLYNLSLPYEIYESEETSEWIWIANDKEDIEFLKKESEIHTKLSTTTNLFP